MKSIPNKEGAEEELEGLDVIKDIWDIKEQQPEKENVSREEVSSDIYRVPKKMNRVPHRKHF